MKKFAAVAAVFVSSLLFTGVAFAGGTPNCQPIYGGGETCVQAGKITLDKKVLTPGSNPEAYVDNLGVSDAKYAPGQTIKFKLTLTNTGNQAIDTIVVKDFFPKYVDFVSGPGSYDTNSKTLTISMAAMNPGETRSFILIGAITDASQISNGQVVCVINQATESNNSQTSSDNAQFCIEKPSVTPTPVTPNTTKGGLPVYPAQPGTTTPPTGPEALALIALLPSGAAGLFLRRKSK